jgi:hypothetical protein
LIYQLKIIQNRLELHERLKTVAGDSPDVDDIQATEIAKKVCMYCNKEFAPVTNPPHARFRTSCPECFADVRRLEDEASEMARGYNGATQRIIFLTERTQSLYTWWLRFRSRAATLVAEGQADIEQVFQDFVNLSCKPETFPEHKDVEWRKYFDHLVHGHSKLSYWEKLDLRKKLENRGEDPESFWLDLTLE